jgi:GNAT superfamily N-acetyltransferase
MADAAAPLGVRAMATTEGDVRRLREFFAAHASDKDPGVLHWQYLRRPVPGTFTHFAEGREEDGMAGVFSLLPNPLRVAGHVRVGAQALDVMTAPGWRGRGVFAALGVAACGHAEREGVAVLYAFPNDRSAPGFWGRLGWTRLDSVPFLVRPLRTRYFLSRLPAAGRTLARLPDLPLPAPRAPRTDGTVEPPAAWDAELDALWERFAAGIGIAVQRDAAFLRWRFAEKPGAEYEARVLRRDGRTAGLVVWCVREKHGGRIGYLMELLHDPARPGDGRALLATAVRAMADAGADAVLAWSLGHAPNHGVYRRGGFVPMPERLRPIRLHFGVRALDPALSQPAGDLRSWYLSYADSDTV